MLYTEEVNCFGAGMLRLRTWQPVPTPCSLAFGNWYIVTMAHFKKGNILYANIWLRIVPIIFVRSLAERGEKQISQRHCNNENMV